MTSSHYGRDSLERQDDFSQLSSKFGLGAVMVMENCWKQPLFRLIIHNPRDTISLNQFWGKFERRQK